MNRRRMVSATLVLVLLASVACGSSRKKADVDAYGRRSSVGGKTVSGQALNAILASSKKTVESKSARMRMALDFAAQFTMTADGAFDFVEHVGYLTMDAAGLGLGDGGMEIRLLGDLMYMKFPNIPQLGEVSGKWIKMDLEALADQAGIDISRFRSLQQDPTSILNALQGVSGEVKDLGTEVVGGVKTTHYEASIDIRKAIEGLDAGGEIAKNLDQMIEMVGSSTLPVQLWIDEQGLLRKLNYSMDLSKIAPPSGRQAVTGTMDIVMELYDFGVKVNVAAPPAAQTIDFGEFLKKAGQG